MKKNCKLRGWCQLKTGDCEFPPCAVVAQNSTCKQQLKDAISNALKLMKKVAPYNSDSYHNLNNAIIALETATI